MEEADKHVISIESVEEMVEMKLKGFENPSNYNYYFQVDPDPLRPTIHKVPLCIRRGNDAAYTPKFLSIGPFHCHKSEELLQVEPLKWKYLHDLIGRSPETNSVTRYVRAVQKVEARARQQYSVELELDSKELVEMLLLDGCFILEFLFKRAQGPVGSPWKDVRWNLPFLRHDLLLLENQVPFFLLQALFDSTDNVPQPPDQQAASLTLMDFALHYVSKSKIKDVGLAEGEEVHHLLHLHHLCELRYFMVSGTSPGRDSSWLYYPKNAKRRVCGLFSFCFFYLVSLVLMWKRPRRYQKKKNKDGSSNKCPRSILNAAKLREAGVTFRRRIQREEEECFLNVTFDDGRLEIPLLSLQQNSIATFRNLIAFEQCCVDKKKQYVTAYAVFMDQLIDTAEDVEILEKNGIVESKLGCDEDVARLFNGICSGASLDYDKHYLGELFRRVHAHCQSDRNRWRADLAHSYFHNPWAVLTFVAGLLLIALTALQTFYTVYQYYRPRNI